MKKNLHNFENQHHCENSLSNCSLSLFEFRLRAAEHCRSLSCIGLPSFLLFAFLFSLFFWLDLSVVVEHLLILHSLLELHLICAFVLLDLFN